MADSFKGGNPFVVPRAILNKGGIRVATMTGNETWTLGSCTFQVLDADGSNRTVTLPDVTGAKTDGARFTVRNAGSTGNILLDDGATVVTIEPGEWSEVVSDGTDWDLLGSSATASTSLADGASLAFGDANDITMTWDGTRFVVDQAIADSEIRWGVDGAGIDQIWYGDTAGSNMTWDQTADSLIFTDDASLVFGDGSDISAVFDGTNLVIATAVADTGAVEFGADDAGVDVILYGDTAGSKITWDQSADSLLITDSTPISFGDGGDVLLQFDATNLAFTTAVADTGAVVYGSDGAGVDVILYGDTASQSITWDQSADDLIMTSAVRIVGAGSTVVPVIPIAAQQALTGAGAANITSYYTALTNTGADAITLADGAQVGQLKKIQMIVDPGTDSTLTPTNLSGGTTITFADVGDYAILCWDGSNWVAIELGNDADGATGPVLA
jgi:hypothetical protein